MKCKRLKTEIVLVLLVFGLLLIPSFSHAVTDSAANMVKDLKVEDIPNDDGSGLLISWIPLPKERRIIEYRLYRGVVPDSLFYIGRIDVNVAAGFSGDRMYYYDTDYNYFLDLQAPGKLKKEKKQSADSPLYGRYPRDIKVTGEQLKNYNILGVIDEKEYFLKSTPVDVVTENDTTTYAGLQLKQLRMYKKLLADKEYYYTVIAVSESRKYFPNVKPAVGIPRENPPEKPKTLYAVYLDDAQRLQFEWSLALFTSDHKDHNIYKIHKSKLAQFNAYLEEVALEEQNELDVKEDSTTAVYKVKTENPAQLIFSRYCGYPYTPVKTAAVPIINNRIVNDEKGIDVVVKPDEIDDYYFVFSFTDYYGNETFSDPVVVSHSASSDLPTLSAFTVEDRPDDKGDYNYLYWEKPVVYLTNATFLNEDKTKLLVNYDVNTNKHFKVKNIYFEVRDEHGNVIWKIDEYYQDKKLNIKIPKELDVTTSPLFFSMSFKCNPDVGDDYTLTQKLVYDPITKSLKPADLFMGNENLNSTDYYVYKRNVGSEEWRLSRKVSSTQRELDDNIKLESTVFKGVSKYDAEKKMFLVSTQVALRYDIDRKFQSFTKLFDSGAKDMEKEINEQIAGYEAKRDSATTDEEREQFTEAIASMRYILDNDIAKELSKLSGKQRRNFLMRVKSNLARSFEYKIVKSDGKGHFTESPVYTTDAPYETAADVKYMVGLEDFGTRYFQPIPNWFKKSMIPALIATLIFGMLVFIMINQAKQGKDLFVRPIAGIQEIDNAIGRATEMGKPILFVPGLSGISDVATLAGLAILGRVAKKSAEYDTRILVPVRDYLVLPIAQEIVKEAHYEAGRPDTYDKGSVFFITDTQFAFVAGVNGVMIREKTATNFYMGMFWAEALLMTETGSTTGAIQIAGTDAVTQIPFFITTCDYTLIGEELYAASAYLAREPLQLGTLKATDYTKMLILIFIILGTLLSSAHLTFLINAFPEK